MADSRASSGLVLLGAGASSSVPLLWCLASDAEKHCKTCHSTLKPAHTPSGERILVPDPDAKNYRTNPALLIRRVAPSGEVKHILIDCGKTFREQALRFFPRHGVNMLDGVVLTHDHADAMLGLDDLRSLQAPNRQSVIPIFLDEKTMATCRKVAPYLTGDTPVLMGVVRHVAQLTFTVIAPAVPFEVAGMRVLPLSVKHGDDYDALGFEFGEAARVVYLSDVSRISPELMALLIERPIDVLFLDSLYRTKTHNTHFCYEESIAVVRELKPRRTVFVGMSHDWDYDTHNAELAALTASGELPHVEMGYDGLFIEAPGL